MTQKELDEIFRITFDECIAISESKGVDYCGTSDVLGHFIEVGRDAGVSPLIVLLIYMTKHFRAIQSYVRGTGESEPIDSRIKDMINYLVLFRAYLISIKESNKIEKYGK